MRIEAFENYDRKVFKYGRGREEELRLGQDSNLDFYQTNATEKNNIYGRVTMDNHLINVEQESNNLKIVDANTKTQLVNYPGTREAPYRKFQSLSQNRIRQIQEFEIRQRGFFPSLEERRVISCPPRP